MRDCFTMGDLEVYILGNLEVHVYTWQAPPICFTSSWSLLACWTPGNLILSLLPTAIFFWHMQTFNDHVRFPRWLSSHPLYQHSDHIKPLWKIGYLFYKQVCISGMLLWFQIMALQLVAHQSLSSIYSARLFTYLKSKNFCCSAVDFIFSSFPFRGLSFNQSCSFDSAILCIWQKPNTLGDTISWRPVFW